MYKLLAVCLLALPSPAFAWERHHHNGGSMWMPGPPVARYENRRTEEYWWWREEGPRMYAPQRLVPYCRWEQGPPIFDRYGNIVACGPAPY
jgi:hypothetical protein